MNPDIQNFVNKIAPVLDALYEEYYETSISPEELASKAGLEPLQVRKALDTLETAHWVERTRDHMSGHEVRLTVFGKEEYDRQSKNHTNEQLRSSLMAHLSKVYEESEYHWTDSDELAKELSVGWNSVCLNLLNLKQQRLVELDWLLGVGHPFCQAKLTQRGKALFDNPPSQVLFISHAAVDRAIATRLREAIEYSYPQLRVFVSSAPDALMAGDPWVQKILDALKESKAAIILTTRRGLSRQWVWFEGGAAWAQKITTIPCCLGKQRKSSLPAPFSLFQAENLDEENDLKALFLKLNQLFGAATSEPNFAELAADLGRLEAEAENRAEQLESPHLAEQREMLMRILSGMDECAKEALRILLLQGEVSDHYALNAIREKGINTDNRAAVFPGLELSTGLVQQVPGSGDGRQNWNLRYRINPEFKGVLSDLLFKGKQSAAM